MRIRLCILTALLLASGGVNAAEVFDVLEVNGHPGYITAYQVSPDGIVDKVLMLVSGFDTDNDDHPIRAGPCASELGNLRHGNRRQTNLAVTNPEPECTVPEVSAGRCC